MKRKRLDRDSWGFGAYPYWQMRIDLPFFRGTCGLIRIEGGEEQYWETPKAGKIRVKGPGMTWLELIPDGEKRAVTAMYFPDGHLPAERERFPAPAAPEYPLSLWYADVTDGADTDEDGVAAFTDKYLDVIFTPEGDVIVDDRDELEAAYERGELTQEQFRSALEECGAILRDLCRDIRRTEALCAAVRRAVEERIARGEPPVHGRGTAAGCGR